jgi:hypothetical protein
MQITDAIKYILDKKAVLIFGSGSSDGAKNHRGNDFPSGVALATELYSELGLTCDMDLQAAADFYEEEFGADSLIDKIRDILNVSEVKGWHSIVYSLPWMRMYTTNYDNVPYVAVAKEGKTIKPLTLSSNPHQYREVTSTILHINGYIGRLDTETLKSEFKLTGKSYLSSDNLSNSKWAPVFRDDLEAAKCIVIIGLSLEYDLDLKRLFAQSDVKDKIIIIDKPNLDELLQKKMRRYGSLYCIGVNGFATHVEMISRAYIPAIENPEDKIFISFQYQFKKQYSIDYPSANDIYNFYVYGTFKDELFNSKSIETSNIVYRECVDEIFYKIQENKKVRYPRQSRGLERQ